MTPNTGSLCNLRDVTPQQGAFAVKIHHMVSMKERAEIRIMFIRKSIHPINVP